MGVLIPPPFPLTLPYRSRVVEQSEWRLCICGPPTQGWVSIFRASFGGDRQHGAGDGGQNVGTDGKLRFFMASQPVAILKKWETSKLTITTRTRGFDSTAVFDWGCLSGKVEEKGGGTRNQREGLKLPIHFASNAPVSGIGMVNTSDMTAPSTFITCCFVWKYVVRGKVGGWCSAIVRGKRILGVSFTAVTLRHFNWALSDA